jgi:branched-chain amino acid transport system ATP-binding protein
MAALLEVADLSAYYGPTKVLHGIGFSLDEGGITTILGANGAGKTTTLRALCGMVRSVGQVTLGGEAITGLATESVAKRGVAHVPEGRGTFTRLSTEENLRLGAISRRDRDGVEADLERMYGYFPRLRERRR